MKRIIASIIYAIFGREIEMNRAAWRKHCIEMQNELNDNNFKRYDWYVDGRTHEVVYNWNKFRRTKDQFVYRVNQ